MTITISDKRILREYNQKLVDSYHSGLGCKSMLTGIYCQNSPVKSEILGQLDQRNELLFQFAQILHQNKTYHQEEFQTLITESAKFIYQQKLAELDLCQDNERCRECVQHNLDCLNSATRFRESSDHYCKNEIEWRSIRVWPKNVPDSCQEMFIQTKARILID